MKLLLTLFISISITILYGQENVGIGTLSPAGKLHLPGSNNASQLIIDANTIQSNTSPLIRLRNSLGNDLMWLHSDVQQQQLMLEALKKDIEELRASGPEK